MVTEAATGAEQVQFQLSPDGTARFNTMAQAAGRGADLAMVVDGVVASAPRLETTDFPGQGVATGLGANAAQALAKRRLNRS